MNVLQQHWRKRLATRGDCRTNNHLVFTRGIKLFWTQTHKGSFREFKSIPWSTYPGDLDRTPGYQTHSHKGSDSGGHQTVRPAYLQPNFCTAAPGHRIRYQIASSHTTVPTTVYIRVATGTVSMVYCTTIATTKSSKAK